MLLNWFLLPILVFWDFASAFPSIIHEWVLLVIRFYRLPEGAINLISGMYYVNLTYMAVGSTIEFIFASLSGVLQGCPMSGMLFNICLDSHLLTLRPFSSFRNGQEDCGPHS